MIVTGLPSLRCQMEKNLDSKERDRQTDRQRQTQRDRERERETDRQTERETDRERKERREFERANDVQVAAEDVVLVHCLRLETY